MRCRKQLSSAPPSKSQPQPSPLITSEKQADPLSFLVVGSPSARICARGRVSCSSSREVFPLFSQPPPLRNSAVFFPYLYTPQWLLRQTFKLSHFANFPQFFLFQASSTFTLSLRARKITPSPSPPSGSSGMRWACRLFSDRVALFFLVGFLFFLLGKSSRVLFLSDIQEVSLSARRLKIIEREPGFSPWSF